MFLRMSSLKCRKVAILTSKMCPMYRPRKRYRSVTVYTGKRKKTIRLSFDHRSITGGPIPPTIPGGSRSIENLQSQPSADENVPALGTANQGQEFPQNQESSYSKKKKDRIKEWQKLRNIFFEASCSSFTEPSSCCNCGETSQLYRCLDCAPWQVLCHGCLLSRHQYPHLHVFEAWQNGTYVGYQEATPTWKLSHQCDNIYIKDLVIIDDKGRQHIRAIQYCSCEEEATTLVRLGLWPSTPKCPRMAFHFDLLRWLVGLILECQVSVKGFCESLRARLPKHYKGYVSLEVQNIYRVLMTESFEEFKHFNFQTERFFPYDASSDDGTQCAACYGIQKKVFSFDANFQLVRKASSGRSWDSSRHSSSNGFFLNQDDVDAFVSNYNQDSKQTDVDCSEFQAASALRSKNKTKKLSETAVFGSTCRHGFPKYFFSLKHGERYGKMVLFGMFGFCHSSIRGNTGYVLSSFY